jgi:hypothetical protein
MKQKNFAKSEDSSTNVILDLENKLGTLLKPVAPRTEFVYELKTNLYNPDYKKKYLESTEWVILIAASFFSGLVLLIVGIRSIVMIIGALGIIRHSANNKINTANL